MTTNYDFAAEAYARFEPPVIVTAQAHAAAVAVLEQLTLYIENYEWREHCDNLPKSGSCRNLHRGTGQIMPDPDIRKYANSTQPVLRPEVAESLERSIRDDGDVWAELAQH